MGKMKLPVDELRVETFAAGEAAEERGTVKANVASRGGCCTRIDTGCNPDITSVFTGACNC